MEFIIGAIFILIGLIYLSQKGNANKADMNIGNDNSSKSDVSNQLNEKKAMEQFISNNYTDAIKELDNLIEIKQHKTKIAYDLRAMACEKSGFYLDAIDDFNESITFDNKDANIYFLRGMAKIRIGEYSMAKIDLEIALSMKPVMQLYTQQLLIVKTMSNPTMEEHARNKAKNDGSLKRREKLSQLAMTSPIQTDELKNGIELMLNGLKQQVKSEPNNQDLQKLLHQTEQRYKDEFC